MRPLVSVCGRSVKRACCCVHFLQGVQRQCDRVVKVMDSKSIGLCPQGFKSPRCRNLCCTISQHFDTRLVRVGAAVTDPVSLPPLPRLSPPSHSPPPPPPHLWQSRRRLPCCHRRPARRRCLTAVMHPRVHLGYLGALHPHTAKPASVIGATTIYSSVAV